MVSIFRAVYLSALSVGIAGIALGQTPQDLTPKQVFEKCHDSVVLIKTDRGQGTGFFVRNSLLVATCYHVIKNAKSIEVEGTKNAKWQVGAVYFDKSCDAAILKLTDETDRKPITLGEFAKVSTGDPLYVIGNPLGLEQTLTNGIMSAKRKVDDVELIQTTAAISPGSSGSPVLNAQGQFVGFASFQFTEGQLLNMAVSSSMVVRLWGEDSIPISTFYASAKTEDTEGIGSKSDKSVKPEKGKGKDSEDSGKREFSTADARAYVKKEFFGFWSALGRDLLMNELFWKLEYLGETHDIEAYEEMTKKTQEFLSDDLYSSKLTRAIIDADYSDDDFFKLTDPIVNTTDLIEKAMSLQLESVKDKKKNGWSQTKVESVQNTMDSMRKEFYDLVDAYAKATGESASEMKSKLTPAVHFSMYGPYLSGIVPQPMEDKKCLVGVSTKQKLPKSTSVITGIRRASSSKFTKVTTWNDLQDQLLDYGKDVKQVYIDSTDGEFLVNVIWPG